MAKFCDCKEQTVVFPDTPGKSRVVARWCPVCGGVVTDVKPRCFYTDHTHGGEGKHKCPACHNLYCDECFESFLPIDPLFPLAPNARICPNCHYNTYHRSVQQ